MVAERSKDNALNDGGVAKQSTCGGARSDIEELNGLLLRAKALHTGWANEVEDVMRQNSAEREEWIANRVEELKRWVEKRLKEEEVRYVGMWDAATLANLSERWFARQSQGPEEAYIESIVDCCDGAVKCWLPDHIPLAALHGAYYSVKYEDAPGLLPKEEVMKKGIDRIAELVLVELATREADGLPKGLLSLPHPRSR
jgi:hypothetical protein